MAAKTSSLLDDADFSNIGKSKTGREKAKGGGSGNLVPKILIAVVCFILGGLGLAYNFNLFQKPVPSSQPGGKGALTASEQEAANEQERRTKEVLTQPGTGSAGG